MPKPLNICFICTAILLSVPSLYAQNRKADSLIALLSTVKDTAKVNLLNQISASYWYTDPNKTFEYAKQAAALGEQLDFKRGVGAAYNNIGIGYYQQNNYDTAIAWYQKAIEQHKAAGNFKGEAYIINNIGLIYWKQGEMPTAVKYYMQALKIWEDHKLESETSSIYDNLGNIYNEQEEYDRAIEYYKKAIHIQKKYDRPPHEYSMTLSNMGSAFLGKENGEQALKYFLESLKFLDEDEKESRAVSLSNIGLAYVEMNNYPKAEEYLLSALKLQEEIGDEDGMIHTVMGLSKTYHKTGRFKESRNYANRALAIVKKINDKPAMSEAYLMLSDISAALGDYKSAYQYFIDHAAARDSIRSKENFYKIAHLQAGLETEKKQAELELLKKETEQQAFRRNTVFVGLIALLIIATLIVSRQRLKIRQNQQLVTINTQLTSQSKQLEEQTEKLREMDKVKSTFFANISHEFRTPLTLILNSLSDRIENVKINGQHEDLQQYEIMHRNAKRLLNLINQLLDLSKLDAKEMKVSPENLDLVRLLGVIHASFTSLANFKEITFNMSVPDEKIICRLDGDKFEKIFYNLLSNAFKFTPRGGRIDFIAELIESSAGRTIKIMVADNGPGIATDQVDQVFNRFYQGKQYYSDEQGTGIGLALTKELVELLGGKITVESSEGNGAKFIVDIPLNEATGEEVFREKKVIHHEFAVGEAIKNVQEEVIEESDKPTVLIVEDNEDLRHYLKRSLGEHYIIIESEDGLKGLQKACGTIPDLVVSDWMMPGMDGITLCQKLKTDERTSHIPVILLTAMANDSAKLQGLETGADDYLTKPFDNKELVIRIKNLIENRRQMRERFSREMLLGPKKIPVTSMDEKFLQKVMDAVERNMGDPEFSMEKFGQQVALSRMQLHRKLKALTNQSPGDFLRSMRLKRAKRLLESRAGNVSEIAYEVGFNNLSYFSKCYKEEFGISPNESASLKENLI
jgi:signal transduction histidine kinase/DNA-binding response OmpR family regulator/Tfp pilus assembly protein PilF